MTGAHVALRPLRTEAERGSFFAFVLAVAGVAISVWLILRSGSDTSHVGWWLVVTPLLVTGGPPLVQRHGLRIAAAIVLAAWCLLTGFSIGMLLVPSLVAAVAAVVGETP